MEKINLPDKTKELRKTILNIIHDCKSAHIGSMFSCLDIVSYLYYKEMNFSKDNFNSKERDRFILSKGHASLAVYSILEDLGIISKETLLSYCKDGGHLIGHLNHFVPGVEVSTGSLGHGLAMATGIALGNKLDKSNSKVYCMISDGECNSGETWESLMFLSEKNLKNLIIIIDANGLQGYDYTDKIFNKEKLIDMLKSLHLNFYNIDGHNFSEMEETFNKIKKTDNEKAHIIFCRTIKGKGISYMENKLEWHYNCPNEEELKKGLEELK